MDTVVYTQPQPAWGATLGEAQLRFSPEDFVVDEALGFAPDGTGEHALLQVRKRGVNTQWLARRLARFANVRLADVGYCGLKDRHAVTTQWFSVPSPIANPIDWSLFAEDGIELLSVTRHERKLRLGAHQANRFALNLRQLTADEAQLQSRLSHIQTCGMPNYFGAQRFGRDGRNVSQAMQWLAGNAKRPDRAQRSLWLSSLRSYLFNLVLQHRIVDHTWNRLLPGERVMLDGSHSVFTADTIDAALVQRCAELDVHPTGPLAGSGDSGCVATALNCETQWLVPYMEMVDALTRQKVKASRRALRVKVDDLHWSINSDDEKAKTRSLRLNFALPSGSYATVLFDELLSPTPID